MYKLYLKTSNQKIMDNLNNSFLDKQLQELSLLYKINNPNDKTYVIESLVIESLNRRVELPNIKSYLNRLIYDVYPNELKSVLETSLPQESSPSDVRIVITPRSFKNRIFPSPKIKPTDDKCSKKIIFAIVLAIVCVAIVIIVIVVVPVLLFTSSKILLK